MVESRAVFGDWLHIRYQNVDAAWVLRVVGGGAVKPPAPRVKAVSATPAEIAATEAARIAAAAAVAAAEKAKQGAGRRRKGGKKKVSTAKEEEEEEAAAGTRGAEMLRLLHPSVQRRLVHIVTHSPFDASPEDLVVDYKEKSPFGLSGGGGGGDVGKEEEEEEEGGGGVV